MSAGEGASTSARVPGGTREPATSAESQSGNRNSGALPLTTGDQLVPDVDSLGDEDGPDGYLEDGEVYADPGHLWLAPRPSPLAHPTLCFKSLMRYSDQSLSQKESDCLKKRAASFEPRRPPHYPNTPPLETVSHVTSGPDTRASSFPLSGLLAA